jgi:hypothetical protein
MADQMRYVGNTQFPVMYESSEPFRVPVKVAGKKAAKRDVKSQVRVSEQGTFQYCAVLARSSDQDEMLYGADASVHLLGTYRASLLLRDVPILNATNVVDVGECVLNNKDGDAKKRAGDNYGNILKAVPPNLSEVLLLLHRMKLNVPRYALAPLFDDGRLELTDDLRAVGYETTEMNRARREREDKALEPFARLMINFPGASDGQSPLRSKLLQMVSKGVTDTVVAGGYAAFEMYMEYCEEGDQMINRVGAMFGGLFGALHIPRSQGLRGKFTDRQSAIQSAARLAMQLQGPDDHRSQSDIIAAIERLQLNLYWMPVKKI